MTKHALVGDVGGTNARLALCDIASGEISQAKTPFQGLITPASKRSFAFILKNIRSR